MTPQATRSNSSTPPGTDLKSEITSRAVRFPPGPPEIWRERLRHHLEKQAENVRGTPDDHACEGHLQPRRPPAAKGEQRLGGADHEMRNQRDCCGPQHGGRPAQKE